LRVNCRLVYMLEIRRIRVGPRENFFFQRSAGYLTSPFPKEGGARRDGDIWKEEEEEEEEEGRRE